MIRDWFKKKSTGCTAQDVRFLYLLCLGRPPHSGPELTSHQGRSILFTLKRLFRHQEMRAMVLDRLAMGMRPPHAALDDMARCDIAAGLQAHFGIDDIAEPLDWRHLLQQAASSPLFGRAFCAEYSAEHLEIFQSSLAQTELSKPVSLDGKLLSMHTQNIRGHVIDRQTPARLLTLDFYLNGLYAGSARADRPDHQYADDYDGHAPFGFDHTLVIPPALRSYDRLSLAIFEKATGAPFPGQRELIVNPTYGTNILQQLTTELRALREQSHDQSAMLAKLEQIEQQLPKLAQYSSFPLDQYHLYQEAFPLMPPQWLATCDVRFDILVYDHGDPDSLRATLSSLRNQSFPAVEIEVVGEGGQVNPAKAYAGAFRKLTGTHLIFLEAGDRLAIHALAWLAGGIEDHPRAYVFYADHDHYHIGSHIHHNPCFQQRFDYDMLIQHNSIERAFAVEREQMLALGAFDTNSGQSFHLYLLLRHYEMYGRQAFHHIPHVLWHLEDRPLKPSTLLGRREDLALVCNSHFKRQGIDACVKSHHDRYGGPMADTVQIEWPIDPDLPKLAVIIPTKDKLELIRPCVESLLETTDYPEQTEIVIVDNGSTVAALRRWLKNIPLSGNIKVIRSETPFNWSALNNLGAQATDADYLLFLNDDTLALDRGWDTALRRQLARPDIGAVGARLLYRNGNIQHAGMVFYELGDARHEGVGDHPGAPHPLNRTRLSHACSAVTGAFLACRRAVYADVGGFDEQLAVTFNDVDFCFKVRNAGWCILYEPQITFQHLQSESRGSDNANRERKARAKKEATVIRDRYQDSFQGDPYYPRAFARVGAPFSRLAPPTLDDIKTS